MEKEKRSLRVLRHGGREAMRILLTVPTGESRMARHMRDLADHLADFAERELFPDSCLELERAVNEGKGYRFSPRRFEVFFTEKISLHGIVVTLVARYTAGERLMSEHALPMLWTRDGAWQRQKKHRIQ